MKAFFKDAIFEDEFMWYFDNLLQALCRMNLKNHQIEMISKYENIEKFIVRWIFQSKDKFYLATNSSMKLLIYDLKKRTIEMVESNTNELSNEISEQFSAFFYANCIWFIPKYTDELMYYYDLKSKKYHELEEFKLVMEKKLGNQIYPITFPFCSQGAIWFTIFETQKYIKFDLSEKVGECIHQVGENLQYEGICYDGNCVWLTIKNSNNILCAKEQSTVIRISEKQSYSYLFNLEKYVVALPRYSNRVVLIDKKTYGVTVVYLQIEENKKKSGRSYIVNCKEHGDYIYLFPHGIKSFFKLNKNTLVVEKIESVFENYDLEIIKGDIEKKRILHESEDINLINLCEYCKNSELSLYKNIQEPPHIGEKIWKVIRPN